jgi:hypothetical protein
MLKTTFSTLDDANRLLREGGLQATFSRFLSAVVAAHNDGRLDSMRRLTARNGQAPGFSNGLVIDVLGPVPLTSNGQTSFPWFTNSSHTRNGHSLVLRLTYGNKTVLLGGDLNAEAEDYLLQHYGGQEMLFQVDVAKSCHHGSSDFRVDFMKAISPFATVISSGDNESYAHPRADAVGAAGRYSRGENPLVFSTELARSYTSSQDILYGMINLRTDGETLVLAQMKERRTGADIWDSYTVPFKPKRR